VRRCEEELTKLSHHLIRFASCGISVPITGLDDAATERVAARWCGTVGKFSGPSATPAIVVLSSRQSIVAATGDTTHDFGSWRTVLRPGNGSDTVFSIGDGVAVSSEFDRAIDLCVTHAIALRGGVVVHGAAFDAGGRGVLVVGDSGSGKSTVAAAALRLGARVVSDDLLLVARRSSGGIGVETLRCELYFRAPGVSIVPPSMVEKLVPIPDSEEVRWRLTPDDEPSSFVDSVVPGRLWLVSVDRRLRESRIAAVDQAEALAWLVRGMSGLSLSGGFDDERIPILDLLADLVASCPAVKVRLGRDLLAEPEDTMDRILVSGGGA
jgi:hypothetical protein